MVFDKISKNDGIGINGLWSLLQNESDVSMAKSTLVKIVKELKEDKRIAMVEERGQKYHLTTDFDYAKTMNEFEDTFESILDSQEEKLSRLETVIKDLPISEKAILLTKFLQIIQVADWRLKAASELINHSKSSEQRNRLQKIMAKLDSMIREWHPDDPVPVILLVNHIEGERADRMNKELESLLKNK